MTLVTVYGLDAVVDGVTSVTVNDPDAVDAAIGIYEMKTEKKCFRWFIYTDSSLCWQESCRQDKINEVLTFAF